VKIAADRVRLPVQLKYTATWRLGSEISGLV